MTRLIFTLIGCGLLLFGVSAWAHDGHEETPEQFNTMCPVLTDEPIDPTQYVEYEGHRIYMCCRRCARDFLKEPELYLANLPQKYLGEDSLPEPSKAATSYPSPLQQAGDKILSSLMSEAEKNNPGLAALHDQEAAFHAEAKAVTALPNPKLTWSYYFDEVETRVGAQEQAFGIMQPLPGYGKRGLRRDAVHSKALATQARQAWVRSDLRRRIALNFYEYLHLNSSIEITQANLGLVEHLEEVAQARGAAGGALAATLKAQMETSQIKDQLHSLQARKKPVRVKLNALVGRALETEIQVPDKQEPPKKVESITTLRKTLKENNPELSIIEEEERGAEVLKQIAQRERWPDLAVGVDYIQTGDAINQTSESGKDPVIARIAINLPIWESGTRSKIEIATAKMKAAEQRRIDRENMLMADLELAWFKYEDALRKVKLYDNELLPQAEQNLSTTEEAYAAGHLDFLNLIEAQRQILMYQLNRARANADAHIQRAEITHLTGEGL